MFKINKTFSKQFEIFPTGEQSEYENMFIVAPYKGTDYPIALFIKLENEINILLDGIFFIEFIFKNTGEEIKKFKLYLKLRISK